MEISDTMDFEFDKDDKYNEVFDNYSLTDQKMNWQWFCKKKEL